MIQWLYRYIFRGVGVLMLIGMITLLVLALSSQMHLSREKAAAAAVAGP